MRFKKVKLKEVLKQYRVEHIVQNEIEYKQVTISKYDGVTFRGTKIGKDIGRKRQFVIDLKTYPNTLMLVRQGIQDGSIGIAPIEVDGCIATENMPMFSIEGINLEYLRFLLKSPYFYDELNKIETTGSAQKSIHERQILEIEIPLPSIEEQKEFVKELTLLKNSGLIISSELSHQLNLIKQLRQAFFREAMQGKLVKSTNAKETGQQLLAKIKAEKAQLIAEKKLKKEKELAPISEDEIPFEIPKNWVWCRLGDLGSFRRGPFGSALTKGIFVKTGYKVYEQKNAIYDNHTLGEYYITSEKFKELKGFVVKPNDLIVSCSGATLGRIAEIPEGAEEGIINQALMRMTLFQSGITNSFFIRLFRSPYMQKKIFDKAWGSAIPNMVGLVEIKKILIPLPPLHDQEQIVVKLEELMTFCDGLEQSIKESQVYNEMLLQQVLREALQGDEV